MVEHSVSILAGVAPLVRVPFVGDPVDGPGGQHGDGHHGADDGEGGNDFPPHCESVLSATIIKLIFYLKLQKT